MDGEGNGTQALEEQEQPQGEGQGQVDEDAQVEPQQGLLNETSADKAFRKAIEERDARIQELEAQVAEAARSTETAEQLRGEIESLKQQAADERVEYELTLAGARNVKAAKALLEDHGGDVSALAAAEPWLFQGSPKATGMTGLKPTGAADENERTMEHWRRIAGLD
nr:hypothetical protein [uncultured Dysosmobacter sp.]